MRLIFPRELFGVFLMVLALPMSSSVAAAKPSLQAPSTDPRNISGVWWTKTYTPRLLPMGGGEVPLTDQGRKLYAENRKAYENRSFEDEYAAAGITTYRQMVAALKVGPIADLKMHPEVRSHEYSEDASALVQNTLHKCILPGVPRIMAAPYPFRIFQTPGQATFLYEMNRTFRVVRMDAQHANPEVWDPSYSGESVGRWEGNTLVIDTTNFNDRTTLDRSGLPHSDQLHVVERLRKINGGRQLEARITMEDPVTFSKPWTTRLVYEWRPDIRPVTDWVCDEPHRDLSEVAGIKAEQNGRGEMK